MPEAKKRAPARRSVKKTSNVMQVNNVRRSVARHSVCQSCNALPVGSVELTALMLVLVFSLSAVLFTSVYALQAKNVEVQELQAQVVDLQNVE